jgi:hypothetical protein
MRYLVILLLLLSSTVQAKPKKAKVVKSNIPVVGDTVIVINLYRPQYGCGGRVEKIIKNKNKSLYLVDVKNCDVHSFTKLSQMTLDEIQLIGKIK